MKAHMPELRAAIKSKDDDEVQRILRYLGSEGSKEILLEMVRGIGRMGAKDDAQKRAGAALLTAREALSSWADYHRQEAEARQGEAAGSLAEAVLNDPEYARVMDVLHALYQAWDRFEAITGERL